MFDRIARALRAVREFLAPDAPDTPCSTPRPRVSRPAPGPQPKSWHAALPALPPSEVPLMPMAPARALHAVWLPTRPRRTPVRPWHDGLPPGNPDDETLIDADLFPLVRRFVLEHEREQAMAAWEPCPLVPALSRGE